jgi:hypothetical protein
MGVYTINSKRHKNPTKSYFAKILNSLGESRDYVSERRIDNVVFVHFRKWQVYEETL